MRRPIPHPEIPPDLDAPRPLPALSTGSGARIWLVRHAEVHADWAETAYGDSDVPLSETGERQTAEVGARFRGARLELVASSPLARALALGRAVSEATGAPLALDARLREVSRGAWQGIPRGEFEARWHADRAAFLADPWRWKGHGGESDAELFARGFPALLEVVARASGGTALVASHQNLLRALVTGALGLGAPESLGLWTAPAHAMLLVDTPGGWRLALRNVPPAPVVSAG